ncbi:Retrovirus-related Pol polyprotein from transposon RE2 [Vitis vinifera]|uniref:Retrovirus-related Pol polyprotein from transposon RE2 n=1 Tax=Vitis vinifera TaxID=29760 RepID=A0A438KQ23_VITVI|nr:Retrovirus-related Pol polyprotein from transposon RE2 [Vitis vinifera]
MVTRSKNGIFKPKVYTVDLNVEEPNTFQEVISHPKWKEAIDKEFRALMKNKTWSLVSLPSNRTSVGCKWVLNSKGILMVLSLVVKPITIRVVLAVVVSQSWSIRQLDINNAFLNGELQEEVYMDQPLESSSQEIHELISRLSGLFSLKDLGELSYFLGIEYRSIVGALQYITITRPEIAFSVNKVCQFMQKPLDTHWKAVKRILRYLNDTTDLGIVLKPSETMNLVGFCDANWGVMLMIEGLHLGIVFFLGKTWLHGSLLSELQTKMTMVPVIWCDSISNVSLSVNPILHSRTKHMELDLYFVNEKVMERKLVVNHIPTEDQVADVLTKPLSFSSNTTVNGRIFVGDVNSGSSFSVGRSSPFQTTVSGTYLICFHFYPFSSPINLVDALFDVSASGFSLLSNFRVANSSNSHVMKGFAVPVHVENFRIDFTPQESSFGFVNAIEVFPAPNSFFPDRVVGTNPAGHSGTYKGVLSQVLYTIHRINVEGLTITPDNDTLWRSWIPDDAYLYFSNAAKNNEFYSDKLKYQVGGATTYSAPDHVYKTAKELYINRGPQMAYSRMTLLNGKERLY